jgi:hypothetical protein
MANVFAVHSVGSSLATYLTNTYPQALRTDHPCTFGVLATGELESLESQGAGAKVTFTLYRVTVNEHLRNSPASDAIRSSVPLSLELHYLMTVWSSTALAEHTVFTWAMSQLHQHPVLDLSNLSSEAGWEPGDIVQVVPEELGTDVMMNIWDAFSTGYRLSTSYVARVVRIDADRVEDAKPVVATRFTLSDVGA